MFYSGKGDDGRSSIFGCDQRFLKSSALMEAVGALDETSSLLGLVSVKLALGKNFDTADLSKVIESIQQNLSIAQAHLGGADKRLGKQHITDLEDWIAKAELELPPIKNFIIPGGSELSAILDYSRTVARRAERQVIAASEAGVIKEPELLMAYLNRLSSALYALARLANHRVGVEEKKPNY